MTSASARKQRTSWDVTNDDAATAELLCASLRRRLRQAQPAQVRAVAALSRASLLRPFTAEVPSVAMPTAVEVFGFGGPGTSWSAGGVDAATATALTVQGSIAAREPIDVCGTLVGTLRVTTTEQQVNAATGEQSGSRTGMPTGYIAIALTVGLLFLPSALRPPPEQTSDSAALSPDAPPDEQAEQVIQSQRQASGGGADSTAWQPEWVQFNANGLDFNNVPRLLPPAQAAHLFGLSAWELPQVPAETECYQAYRTVDPANEPDAGTCKLHWHLLVMIMNGIQEAGPHLDQASFDKGLLKLGRSYPPEPWAIGGGYGVDDYSYMDTMAEIWWSGTSTAPDPEALGSYRWTTKGRRYKRGEIPTTDNELFSRGVTYPGGPEA